MESKVGLLRGVPFLNVFPGYHDEPEHDMKLIPNPQFGGSLTTMSNSFETSIWRSKKEGFEIIKNQVFFGPASQTPDGHHAMSESFTPFARSFVPDPVFSKSRSDPKEVMELELSGIEPAYHKSELGERDRDKDPMDGEKDFPARLNEAVPAIRFCPSGSYYQKRQGCMPVYSIRGVRVCDVSLPIECPRPHLRRKWECCFSYGLAGISCTASEGNMSTAIEKARFYLYLELKKKSYAHKPVSVDEKEDSRKEEKDKRKWKRNEAIAPLSLGALEGITPAEVGVDSPSLSSVLNPKSRRHEELTKSLTILLSERKWEIELKRQIRPSL
ncbi:hypothetical protein ACFE04_019579 [Oxalis oulophora]